MTAGRRYTATASAALAGPHQSVLPLGTGLFRVVARRLDRRLVVLFLWGGSFSSCAIVVGLGVYEER